MPRIVGLAIESDQMVGAEGGFLAIRRLVLRNRHDDGGLSRPYLCDFLVRAKGVDAVVVAVYRRGATGVEVLLRDGLRPPLALGRGADSLPVPDARPYLFFREVVAGIVERGDTGERGLRERAAIEVAEEAGLTVAADAVVLLGAGVFPSPGAMAERFWLCAVEVGADTPAAPPPGDGSPMEEDAAITWLALEAAIAACVAGELEDAKTELVLRRLRDRLG